MLLLNHTCDTYRLKSSGGLTKSMCLLKRGVPCLALPMAATTAIQNEMQLGRAYSVTLATAADVQPGDRLLCNGMKLSVRFVRSYIGVPPVDHIKALCEAEVS